MSIISLEEAMKIVEKVDAIVDPRAISTIMEFEKACSDCSEGGNCQDCYIKEEMDEYHAQRAEKQLNKYLPMVI